MPDNGRFMGPAHRVGFVSGANWKDFFSSAITKRCDGDDDVCLGPRRPRSVDSHDCYADARNPMGWN